MMHPYGTGIYLTGYRFIIELVRSVFMLAAAAYSHRNRHTEDSELLSTCS